MRFTQLAPLVLFGALAAYSSGCARPERQVVRVEVVRSHDEFQTRTHTHWNETFELGTGVCIGGNRVLTAYHVMFQRQAPRDSDLSKGVRVRPWDPESGAGSNVILGGEKITPYPAMDLSIIEGLSFPPDVRPADVATDSVPIGQSVTVFGYGEFHDRLSRHTGEVLLRSDDKRWFIISMQTHQGDSGGPVFDRDGRLCGLLMGGERATVMYEHFSVTLNHDLSPPYELRTHGFHARNVEDYALVLDLPAVFRGIDRAEHGDK